ncbi:MAG: ABC-type transport auxiliary lipoprotein family protein [Terricaulis sp.]
MRIILALMSTVALAGCVTLLPEPPPPPALFVLEAGNVQRVEGAPVDAVISVAQPGGERAILGADLIWRTGDSLAYVNQVQWSGRADARLQALLVETISRQGRARAAVRSGSAQSDYEVRWDVLDFEVVESGGGFSAHFSADVKIVDTGRRVLASEIITAEAPVSSRSSSAAADGLARAAREGSARIALLAADTAAQAEAQAAEEVQSRAASINR